jgi:hypothetical protein
VCILESIQDGIQLEIQCELKENIDELEQKRKLGFIWDEASELQKLLAIRNNLDGMVVSTGCIIGAMDERSCVQIKVRKNANVCIESIE